MVSEKAISIYSTQLKPVLEPIGLHNQISGAYNRLMHSLSSDVIEHEFEGYKVRYYIQGFHEWQRHHTIGERPIIEDLVRELRPDDVFFDIGANIGTYTCVASAIIEGGNVVAFEPHPANMKRLRSNVALNEGDVMFREIALSDSQGVSKFSGTESRPGIGSHALSPDEKPSSITVETSTGDSLVSTGEFPTPSVVKIDVEGAEQLVLDGFESILRSGGCRFIYVELHPKKWTNMELILLPLKNS